MWKCCLDGKNTSQQHILINEYTKVHLLMTSSFSFHTCKLLVIESVCRNRFWSDESEKAERQKTQNSKRKHFEKGSERKVEQFFFAFCNLNIIVWYNETRLLQTLGYNEQNIQSQLVITEFDYVFKSRMRQDSLTPKIVSIPVACSYQRVFFQLCFCCKSDN